MTRKINICFIANNANHSGAARSLWQVVKYIDKERFACNIIINREGAGLSKLVPYARCHSFKIKQYRFRYTYKIRKILSYLFEKRWFIRKIRQLNPDIIYFNTNAAIQYMQWSKEALPGAKIICHIHAQNEGLTYKMMMPEKNVPLDTEWINTTKHVPDYFIACACASRDVLMNHLQIPASKIMVAHESIDVDELKTLMALGISRQELGWEDKTVVGVVATLAYRKGIDIFIEAVNFIQQQNNYHHLLFVWLGSDGYTKKNDVSEHTKIYQEKITNYNLKEKLLLLGHKADIYKYMMHLDVFVLPTRDECLPLSLLEAMVLKIPVVATTVSGIPEVINDTNGLLVEPTPKSVASGILRALNALEHKDYSRQRKASSDVLAFDVKKQVVKIENYIEDIFRTQKHLSS